MRRCTALLTGLATVAAPLAVLAPAVAADPPTCADRPATIVGTAGVDNLVGTSGDDVVWLGAGDDTFQPNATGPSGDDVVCGGEGDDTITGGTGDDDLFGEEGDDALAGADGADALHGGPGDDGLSGGVGPDTLSPGDGSDTVTGEVDEAGAAVREDTLDLGTLSNGVAIYAITGAYTSPETLPTGPRGTFTGIARFVGSTHDDVFTGTRSAEAYDTNGGADEARMLPGDDELVLDGTSKGWAGKGDDEVTVREDAVGHMAPGDDTGTVEAGELFSGRGDDTVFFTGDTPGAAMHGDRDRDQLSLTRVAHPAYGMNLDLRDGVGHFRKAPEYGNFTAHGFEWVRGSSGNDVLLGTWRGEKITGWKGDDRLHGRAGRDNLAGGPDHDQLFGGPGKDRCSGEEQARC